MDAFDQIELSPSDVRDVYKSNPNKDAFDEIEYEESFGKNLVRSLYQVGSGIGQAVTYPLDLLSMIGHAEAADPIEIDRIRQISEREGIPFDEEKYFNALEASQKYFPTQSNAERIFEEKTGFPATPKTKLQKGIKYASTIGKFAPGNFAQKAVIGGAVEGAKEGLQSYANVPEGVAEFVAPAFLGPAAYSQLPSLSFGQKTKPSGLTERRFEKIKKPLEISKNRFDKLNQKIENEFHDITNRFIEKGPVKETHAAMKADATFKSNIADMFAEVEELANQIPGNFSSEEVKNAIAKKYQAEEGIAITPGEYQENYQKSMRGFLKKTPTKLITPKELVTQYRLNNKELGEYFKPGESSAYNNARRDALLDYNKIIAEMIEDKYPKSEFAEVFKFSNKKWTEINDLEKMNDFFDELFKGKINHKVAEKFLRKNKTDLSFKRALGEENYPKFIQLLKDLMSQEQAYRLLKQAENKGYTDLAKTGLYYFVHPNLAGAKIATQTTVQAGKGIFKFLLDKPRFAFIWDDGLKALKKGDFARADKNFKILKDQIEIIPKETKTKTIEKPTVIEVKSKKLPVKSAKQKYKPIADSKKKS